MSLQKGDKAPDFELYNQAGKLLRRSELKNKILVLFFYPKDQTPGCIAEACGFRDNYDLFRIFGAEVWGVSGDDINSHSKFSKQNNLPFPLLSDIDNQVRKSFGVPNTLGIIPGRVSYIIDSEGIIQHTFNNLLDGPAHVNEALSILSQIRNQ